MTIKSSGNKKYSILAIIPARGGSKGIKDKNVRLVNGIPLICHTIRLLKSIKFIDNSIVSTDSKKIKNISIKNGIEVPFLRPKYLSGDNVADMPVLQHALKNCEANYKKTHWRKFRSGLVSFESWLKVSSAQNSEAKKKLSRLLFDRWIENY